MAMHKKEEEKLIAKLESDGETIVRENISRGIYGHKKIPIINDWLRQQEQKKDEQKYDKDYDINAGLLAVSKSSRNAAWVATIIAFLAFLASLFFYISGNRKNSEDILIKVGIRHGSYGTEVMKGPNDQFPAMIPVRWKCQLVNNGIIPVNLMNFRLKQISKEFPEVDQLIGISSNEQESLILPISLEPGENRTIYILASVLINKENYHLLSNKYSIGTNTSNYKIRLFWLNLNRNNSKDIDNIDIKYNILPPIERESKQQFLATFESSRGNNFYAIFSEFGQ